MGTSYEMECGDLMAASEQEPSRSKIGIQTSVIGLVVNLMLVGIKLFAGYLANSVAIMADAMNSIGDSTSAILAMLGFYYASKPADRNHPYGHQRTEYISGLLTAVIILIVGFEFLITSVEKILNPTEVVASKLVIALLFLSMLIKGGLGLYYTYRNRQLDTPSKVFDALIKDSISDLLANLVIIVSYFAELATGLHIDGYIGAIVALIIIYNGFGSIIASANDIVGTRPDPDLVSDIQDVLDTFDSIIDYHDLHLHQYGPQQFFATVDIEIDSRKSLLDAHQVIDEIEARIEEDFDIQLVAHLDPIVINDAEQNHIYKLVKDSLKQLRSDFHFHDFRIQEQANDVKAIHFDVVVPDDIAWSDEQLLNKLYEQLNQRLGFPYSLHITFDRNYVLNHTGK
ncbi:cation-efflux pump [Suicoccus acidiformans]|uniref:Cation-efflux pump n=2 Tax=Suicoccus acidiformans TaxID=2036206 RepID=A0A347WM45_9LACT|nr:cation-efflux pump [Suicoccus acidiformans]